MLRRIFAVMLIVSLLTGTAVTTQSQTTGPAKVATADQQAMDKLLAPVALYPDALLAQVLACASSPEQVREMNQWIQKNSQLKGSELQAAAEKAGFDASFIALVLFPDVLKLMEQNMEWTTEIGKAFVSDQKAVLDSAQRLRAQAQAAGNLKTTQQQEVKVENQDGTQVIVIQPANPQVVYVPVYSPQTAYTPPPPPPPTPAPAAAPADNSGDVAAAAIIGFGLGIVLGAAMADDHYGYYGWGAWGMGWHSHTVVVAGGPWRVPPRPRYPYARPVPAYRPNVNVRAPTYNNVNINVDRNVNRQTANTNVSTRTPRPTTTSAPTARPSAQPTARATSAGAQPSTHNASRGRPPAASTTPSATQMERGSRTSAFSGYQSGTSQRAASTRGSASARSAQSGSRRAR